MPIDPDHPGELVREPTGFDIRDIDLPGVAAGVTAIARERIRQVAEEGYTDRHDDAHTRGEIACAAALYAIPPEYRGIEVSRLWPWGAEWKPNPFNRIRELEKAGALIAAEIDRLHRVAARNGEATANVG